MKIWFRYMILFLFAWCAPIALADTPPPTPPAPPAPPPPTPPKPDVITMTREEYDKLIGRKEDPPPPPKDDDPLRDRVRKDREDRERVVTDQKAIETALAFTMGLDAFVSKNADLLPSEIGEIVKVANAETYDSASSKANAVKRSVIETYFSVQANREALTEFQKRDLDDYMKLTKTGREEKATSIYSNIFEPTLEMNRRLKKADEVRRGQSGVQTSTGTEAQYHQRLIAGSRKRYLGK